MAVQSFGDRPAKQLPSVRYLSGLAAAGADIRLDTPENVSIVPEAEVLSIAQFYLTATNSAPGERIEINVFQAANVYGPTIEWFNTGSPLVTRRLTWTPEQ